MKIEGEYINRKGRTVGVAITTPTGDGTITIGVEGSSLQWGSDSAVTIEGNFNDPMDVVLAHSATISLSARDYVPELFARGSHDVKVVVTLDDAVVFRGFLEPGTYSQDYVSVEDDLELNCIDALAAMQYAPFKGVGSGTTYADAVANADTATFDSLLQEALAAGWGSSDGFTVRYDGSRSLPGNDSATVLEDLSVSELVFLGDDEDDVWNYQQVVEAVLKYLNLHIVQDGDTFYIFSWESVRKGDGSAAVTLTTDIVEDDNCQMDVTEAYNKLSLEVSPKSVDELVSSPLDAMESAYPRRMRYCTEYRAHYLDEFKSFLPKDSNPEDMLASGTIKDAYWQDWYLLVKRNADWLVGRCGKDMVEEYKTDDLRQENIVNQLAFYPGAALVSLGRVQHNASESDLKDNSPQSTLEMSDYLVISNYEASDGESTYDPLVTPIAEYRGGSGGAVISPPDSKSTNYIVISGTMRLQKKEDMSITVGDLADAPLGVEREMDAIESAAGTSASKSKISYKAVKSNGHADCYLACRWYKNTASTGRVFGNLSIEDLNPQGVTVHPANWPDGVSGYYSNGLRMPSEFDEPDFEYSYSGIKNSTDKLSKVPVLECMLRVGDKVLVEDMTMNGSIESLSWQDFKDMDTCKALHPDDDEAAEDEYWSQTFSIGFDPKIGDHLLNEDHAVQTNFTWELGIDTDEGMAIPVEWGDHLHGKVEFRIVGLVNSFYYNKITRRHRTWFRGEKWSEYAIPLMANVRGVFIKDFSIKLYSDNAMDGNSGDNGGSLVYTSDTDEEFLNKKDDIEFKLHSAFTTAECAAQGLSPVIALTTVTATASGDGCLQITDTVTNTTAKAEELYVDAYYSQMHVPRVRMTLNLQDTGTMTPWSHYYSAAMGKEFFVESFGRNLLDGSMEVTMEEMP